MPPQSGLRQESNVMRNREGLESNTLRVLHIQCVKLQQTNATDLNPVQ